MPSLTRSSKRKAEAEIAAHPVLQTASKMVKLSTPRDFSRNPRLALYKTILETDDEEALNQNIIEGIENRLEKMLQRIRKKVIYIVGYRAFQVQKEWVPIEGVYNKYVTTKKSVDPQYSARSMLKLIRWCRHFKRVYDPKVEKNEKNSVKFLEDLKKERQMEPVFGENNAKNDAKNECCEKRVVSLSGNMIKNEGTLKTPESTDCCFICKIDDFCVPEGGVFFCQECLWRKAHFIQGYTLQCNKCDCKLESDNFEFWMGENWCKTCLFWTCVNSGLIVAQ